MKIYKVSSNLPPITSVAIKDANGRIWSLPKPNRHGDVIKLMLSNGVKGEGECGFLADDKFLSRIEAFKNALENNQILPPYNPTNPSERRWDLAPPSEPFYLHSEDLW